MMVWRNFCDLVRFNFIYLFLYLFCLWNNRSVLDDFIHAVIFGVYEEKIYFVSWVLVRQFQQTLLDFVVEVNDDLYMI